MNEANYFHNHLQYIMIQFRTFAVLVASRIHKEFKFDRLYQSDILR